MAKLTTKQFSGSGNDWLEEIQSAYDNPSKPWDVRECPMCNRKVEKDDDGDYYCRKCDVIADE